MLECEEVFYRYKVEDLLAGNKTIYIVKHTFKNDINRGADSSGNEQKATSNTCVKSMGYLNDNRKCATSYLEFSMLG